MGARRWVGRHRQQSRFSNPGRFADLLASLPTEPAELSAVARNVIVRYRASGHDLPEHTRNDIHLRWIESLLAIDQCRHRAPLTAPRQVTTRVQGCCRDHTLLCVSVLRAHDVAARSRVGFAGYFADGWHHDHVIVEAWIDGRWQRFDPELADPAPGVPIPTDMTWSPAQGRGFVSAANAWLAHRRGQIDPDTFGVDPAVPVHRGPRFLFNEVIIEIAHRFGDELLLWDDWGRME
ncbi:MAG: transglutaminase domain-containing protein, partial [Nocardioidaceae bacterium]